MPAPALPQPVGVLEIADLLDVRDRTVHQWIRRPSAGMPEADCGIVNGSRAWDRRTIIEWAGRTGRLPDGLAKEYVALTGEQPLARRLGGRLPTPPPQPPPPAAKRRSSRAKAPR